MDLSIFPIEVIRLIISYSYSFQDKNLLTDIKHFYTSKQIFNDLYTDNINSYIDIEWQVNDLIIFYNTTYGFTNYYYNIFFRNKFLLTKAAVNNYVKIIHQWNQKELNVYWGLLYPAERDSFLERVFKTRILVI